MSFSDIEARGLVLVGCGKMGSAMLAGWLGTGLPASCVHVAEPSPSDWLKGTGVNLNADLPGDPAIVVLAVKPQMMSDVLSAYRRAWGEGAVILSIAAGTPISTFEDAFGDRSPVIRAMPNTPAAIGKGITAIVGNSAANEAHMALAEALLSAVGQTVRLSSEDQMDAVTAVSGSGPAYVFHLIETLTAAGVAEGLPAPLADKLARATVAGAGALAETSDEDPGTLRVNVTSPGGTTAAALAVLMDETRGFPALLPEAVARAAARSRELRG